MSRWFRSSRAECRSRDPSMAPAAADSAGAALAVAAACASIGCDSVRSYRRRRTELRGGGGRGCVVECQRSGAGGPRIRQGGGEVGRDHPGPARGGRGPEGLEGGGSDAGGARQGQAQDRPVLRRPGSCRRQQAELVREAVGPQCPGLDRRAGRPERSAVWPRPSESPGARGIPVVLLGRPTSAGRTSRPQGRLPARRARHEIDAPSAGSTPIVLVAAAAIRRIGQAVGRLGDPQCQERQARPARRGDPRDQHDG